jgi:hypothetical protein
VMVETKGKRELPAVVRWAMLPEGRLPKAP